MTEARSEGRSRLERLALMRSRLRLPGLPRLGLMPGGIVPFLRRVGATHRTQTYACWWVDLPTLRAWAHPTQDCRARFGTMPAGALDASDKSGQGPLRQYHRPVRRGKCSDRRGPVYRQQRSLDSWRCPDGHQPDIPEWGFHPSVLHRLDARERRGREEAKGLRNRKTTFLHQCTPNRFPTPYLPRSIEPWRSCWRSESRLPRTRALPST